MNIRIGGREFNVSVGLIGLVLLVIGTVGMVYQLFEKVSLSAILSGIVIVGHDVGEAIVKHWMYVLVTLGLYLMMLSSCMQTMRSL